MIGVLYWEKEVDKPFFGFSVSILYLAEHDKAIKLTRSGALLLTKKGKNSYELLLAMWQPCGGWTRGELAPQADL